MLNLSAGEACFGVSFGVEMYGASFVVSAEGDLMQVLLEESPLVLLEDLLNSALVETIS